MNKVSRKSRKSRRTTHRSRKSRRSLKIKSISIKRFEKIADKFIKKCGYTGLIYNKNNKCKKLRKKLSTAETKLGKNSEFKKKTNKKRKILLGLGLATLGTYGAIRAYTK